jgi:glycosyltransferase involved in cell wall biosynthesis
MGIKAKLGKGIYHLQYPMENLTFEKVSVVVTVLNEEKNIERLLLSLLNQSKMPNEIVIVDGGSIDRTLLEINKFARKQRQIDLHVIREPGNISHGRNVGIKKAKFNIIAITDAGCIAHRDWLFYLTKPFAENKNIAVAGFYSMKCDKIWQKASALFLGVTPNNFNKNTYLPSARSLAITKKVLKDISSFNEELSLTAEDTYLAYLLVKKNIRIIRVQNAIVTWDLPDSFVGTIKKFFYYAKGDVETGIWWHPIKGFKTHNIKVVTVFIRYLMFVGIFLISNRSNMSGDIFFIVIFMYVLWSVNKHKKNISEISTALIVPVIQILSDLSVMGGFISGVLSIVAKKKYNILYGILQRFGKRGVLDRRI